MLFLTNLPAKKNRKSTWQLTAAYLSHRRIEELIGSSNSIGQNLIVESGEI
jgi:hypothetical protein